MSGPTQASRRAFLSTTKVPTAADWGEWHQARRSRPVPLRECEWVYRSLAPQRGMTAVDLGCGTGQWAYQMFRWGMQVAGFDPARRCGGPAESVVCIRGCPSPIGTSTLSGRQTLCSRTASTW